MGTLKSLLLICMSAVVVLGIIVGDANANFTKRDQSQNELGFDDMWDWDFDNGGYNPAVIEKPNWDRTLQSAGALAGKSLTLHVRHIDPPPPGHVGDIPVNPPQGTMDVELGGLMRPQPDPENPNKNKTFFYVQAKQFSHPNKGHSDFIALRASVPVAGDVTVNPLGRHDEKKRVNWSFVADKAGGDINYVIAYYDDGTNDLVAKGPIPAGLDKYVGGSLDPRNTGKTPVGYKLKYSDPTELTLAFLGEVDGVPGMLNLSGGFDLFGDEGRIVAPMFVDAAANPLDLFVAVDLVQWLSFPTPYDPLDTFSITSGRSELLPGYLFSTSPIDYDPLSGFTTGNPFDGDVFVAGNVDGSTVPEPATLILLGLGSLVMIRRRRA